MSSSFVAVVGDIGGTNARLQLFWYSGSVGSSSASLRLVIRQTYRTNTFSGLASILQRFFDDVGQEQDEEEVRRAMERKK